MGYVFDFQDAQSWRCWAERPAIARLSEMQSWLMRDMLAPKRLDTLLSIGCGTCGHLAAFIDGGLDVTGIDPSPYMLDMARERFGHRVDLHRGAAERLPFDDNRFNHVVLFGSLEFVDDPSRALAEAFRVAKDHAFIGIWNRCTLARLRRRMTGREAPPVFDHARFFSIWQVRRLVRELLGDVPAQWRTVGQLPSGVGHRAHWFERLRVLQHCPFGDFAGMVVTLVPRFRVRPLDLTCGVEQRPVAGC